MGLRHRLRDSKGRLGQARIDKAMRQLGAMATQASPRRWASLNEILGEDLFFFIATKWRLTENEWAPGEAPRRPRSAEEIASHLGKSVEVVRKVDADTVRLFASDPQLASMPDWGGIMTVPVDEAQEWWDRPGEDHPA